MSPVCYASNTWVAFSFIKVFFSEGFLFVGEYSNDWFSSHIGNEEIIRVKVGRVLKRWGAVMLIRVRFSKLRGAGVDFFQAMVEGRI